MNGWGEKEPAWWLNLQAQPDTTVELPGGRRAVRARAAVGEERERLWATFPTTPAGATTSTPSPRGDRRETAVVVLEPRAAVVAMTAPPHARPSVPSVAARVGRGGRRAAARLARPGAGHRALRQRAGRHARPRAGAGPGVRDRPPPPGPPRGRPATCAGPDGAPRRPALQPDASPGPAAGACSGSPPPASCRRSGSSAASRGSRTSWSTWRSARACGRPTGGAVRGGRHDDGDALRRRDRRWRGCRLECRPRPGTRPAPGGGGRRRVAPQRAGGPHAGVPVPRRDAAGGPARRRAGGGQPLRRGADRGSGRRHRRRVRRPDWPAATSWRRGGSCSRPASGTSCRTSRAFASGGAATCCTARTATGGRSATSRSGCSARGRTRSSTRCSSGSGRTTWSSSSHTLELGADDARRLEARGVRVVPGAVERLVIEDDRLTGVELVDGRGHPSRRGLHPTRERPPRGRPAGGARLRGRCRRLPDRRWDRPDQRRRASGPRATPWTRASRSSRRPGTGSAPAIAINADLVQDDVAESVRSARR